MALRKEEFEELLSVSRKLMAIPVQAALAEPVQETEENEDKAAIPEGFISGIKREVRLANGVIRKFRFDTMLRLKWVSDSDGSYIRPNVNGEWVRKTPTKKYRLSNVSVDSLGTLTYEREIDSRLIRFVEKIDLSTIGRDEMGRIAHIEYANGLFSTFYYNALGHICKFTAPDGSTWNANDEMLWRKWPTCRQDLHGVMEVQDDGSVKFLNFVSRRGVEPMLITYRADGEGVESAPLLPALNLLLEENYEKLPLQADGSIDSDTLYRTLRDLPVSGATRVAATMLWHFARHKPLKQISREQIAEVTQADDYARTCALLVARTIHLRNIFREEDNANIKRVGRYQQLRLVLARK